MTDNNERYSDNSAKQQQNFPDPELHQTKMLLSQIQEYAADVGQVLETLACTYSANHATFNVLKDVLGNISVAKEPLPSANFKITKDSAILNLKASEGLNGYHNPYARHQQPSGAAATVYNNLGPDELLHTKQMLRQVKDLVRMLTIQLPMLKCYHSVDSVVIRCIHEVLSNVVTMQAPVSEQHLTAISDSFAHRLINLDKGTYQGMPPMPNTPFYHFPSGGPADPVPPHTNSAFNSGYRSGGMYAGSVPPVQPSAQPGYPNFQRATGPGMFVSPTPNNVFEMQVNLKIKELERSVEHLWGRMNSVETLITRPEKIHDIETTVNDLAFKNKAAFNDVYDLIRRQAGMITDLQDQLKEPTDKAGN